MQRQVLSDRRARLVRALVASLVPIAMTPVITACGVCPPLEQVVTISPETALDLSQRFGNQSIPLQYCEELCGLRNATTSSATTGSGTGGAGGASDAAGPSGAGGAEVSPFLSITECHLVTTQYETLAVLCTGTQDCGGVGRKPPGLISPPRLADDGTGARFAEMATLEEASIAAFVQLARELTAFGAPKALVARAYAAARDEARHTKIATMLARRHGVEPEAPQITATALRSLVEVAVDNAREGCVGETFGALALAKQARTEADPFVAHAFAEIARDEAEHAALSFDVDAWLRGRLSSDERDAVSLAEETALSELDHRGDGIHSATAAEVRRLCAA